MLDTWVVAAWLKNQPAAAATRDLLWRNRRGEISLAMNVVHWGETFYVAAQYRGLQYAARLLDFLRPQLALIPAPEELVFRPLS